MFNVKNDFYKENNAGKKNSKALNALVTLDLLKILFSKFIAHLKCI